jgi:hypothetical protein
MAWRRKISAVVDAVPMKLSHIACFALFGHVTMEKDMRAVISVPISLANSSTRSPWISGSR